MQSLVLSPLLTEGEFMIDLICDNCDHQYTASLDKLKRRGEAVCPVCGHIESLDPTALTAAADLDDLSGDTVSGVGAGMERDWSPD